MILLLTVFLIIHEAFGQNIHLYIEDRLDEFRRAVARGTFPKPGGGNLPSSSAMFALTENSQLNFVALSNVYNCIKPSNPHLAKGYSMNFFSVTNTSARLTERNIVDKALAFWTREPISYRFRDDVIYDNTSIQNIANMIYYQATMYGCAVRTCHGSPATYAFVCVFDKEPVLNAPLYIVSPNPVRGCVNDSDCEKALPFAKCLVYSGLCSPSNNTDFKEMSTTTPTTLSTTTTTTTTSMPTTTTTTTMQTSTTTPSSNGIITKEIRLKIINMHNYRRSRLAQGLVPNGKTGGNLPAGSNIFRMTYNMELERAAQAYANTCPSNGSTSLPTMGENFASIPSNTMEVYDCVVSAIKSFWSQIRTESINSKVMFTEQLMMSSNGPLKFTQMAWANTHDVGCGAQRCAANTVVVCRYSPRGNIVNESIYTRGPMCSTCLYGGCTTDKRQQGLCPAGGI
ncbi:hypothetical protein GCK32_003766 [Trichostrongylus colubriformis]|uniref:SCP domain-containing protein n=1 Tax=Trichostrongylus colubriformis TaxID=6319 RepID=A0AAN8FCM4_TRICO